MEQVATGRVPVVPGSSGDSQVIHVHEGITQGVFQPLMQITIQDQIAHNQRVASQALVLTSQEAISRNAVNRAVVALASDNTALRTKNEALLKRVKVKAVEDVVAFRV